jgi:hypothetical protein
MAASSIADLHTFEEHIESAAVTFLNTATGLDVYRSNSEADYTTPRIEVKCEVGDAYDAPAERGNGAAPTTIDWLAYTSTFVISISTDNPVGQSADMVTYVGQVRAAMLRSEANWDSSTLPYYDVKELKPISTSQDADGDYNQTELSYLLIFEIRQDAWPA